MGSSMFHKLRNRSIVILLIIFIFVIASVGYKNFIKSTYLNSDIPTVKVGDFFYDMRANERYIVNKVEVSEEITNFYFETPLNHQGYKFKGINPDQSLSEFISTLQDSEENVLIQTCKDICVKFERYVLVNAFDEQLVVLEISND